MNVNRSLSTRHDRRGKRGQARVYQPGVYTRRCLRSDWYALARPWSSVLICLCIHLRAPYKIG